MRVPEQFKGDISILLFLSTRVIFIKSGYIGWKYSVSLFDDTVPFRLPNFGKENK